MKLQQLASWLELNISLLETTCAHSDTAQLSHLTRLCKAHPNVVVSALAGAIENADVAKEKEENVRELSNTINLMVAAASHFGKVNAVKPLIAFSEALSCRRDTNVSELLSATEERLAQKPKRATRRSPVGNLKPGEVEAYLTKLEEALGDEMRFKIIFQSLEQDNRVKAPDAKNIAKRFAGKAGKNKGDAFRLIYERHSALVGSRERAKSTAGRSAA